MFRSLGALTHPPGATVTLQVDGQALEVPAGQMLAVALMAANRLPLRTSLVSGAPRAPLCLMGACFECLVEVDGVRNVQACMVPVRSGMQVHRQLGKRPAGESA